MTKKIYDCVIHKNIQMFEATYTVYNYNSVVRVL